MFTVELYARIRRAVMVEELHYILLVVIKAELSLFLSVVRTFGSDWGLD